MKYEVIVKETEGSGYKNDSSEVVNYKTDTLDIPALVEFLGKNSKRIIDKEPE